MLSVFCFKYTEKQMNTFYCNLDLYVCVQGTANKRNSVF